MKQKILIIYLVFFIIATSSCNEADLEVNPSKNDLVFPDLAQTWDEGMPLGNAAVGALIWQKDSSLRLSLDRVDLWDLRPTENIYGENFSFEWVYNQVLKKDYRPVQQLFDLPYDRDPAPSKIPGAGLEFSLKEMGELENIRLYLNNALCEINWENGSQMKTFVHASLPLGWFVVSGTEGSFVPELVPPVYNTGEDNVNNDPVTGLSLRRLGYEQGTVTRNGNKIVYHQKGWGDFYYEVAVKYEKKGKRLYGIWSVTSSLIGENASELVEEYFVEGPEKQYAGHLEWWDNYWAKSSVNLPDTILQKQYYNEMYKFGSVTRKDSYPISLQAVWTADHGKLPPWKGDYHHDLNTQMSNWPAFTSNRIEEAYGYINTLWNQRETNKKYTKTFFGTSGLNVPGVSTLTGEPMGGWIQYALSPTASAWLAHNFYLHWKYSADRQFLEERGYPYLKDVATHLEELTVLQDGKRALPLSSSPEIFDNSLKAWFLTFTNYDLALVSFAFTAAAEMADALGKMEEATYWQALLNELPDYVLGTDGGLAFAQGFNYDSSHRHFSHLMAFHPLGLIDWSNGKEDQQIIKSTIDQLIKMGPRAWTGYSYSWLGNLQARAFNGEGAASALRDFANHFCLRNTFHVNGDQTNSGKSGFTYRPFTLEGNFGFAAGIHEMLIQSHTGILNLFPAIPNSWKNVSFDKLRTYGSFLVSAEMKEGDIALVKIRSERGGVLKMKNPFERNDFTVEGGEYRIDKGLIIAKMEQNEEIVLKR